MSAPASLPRMLTVVVVVLLAIGAFVLKPDGEDAGDHAVSSPQPAPSAAGTSRQPSQSHAGLSPQRARAAARAAPVAARAGAAPAATTPRIVEFGSDRCVPCRLMQPVLASLRARYGAALVVEFVDVVKDREAGARNAITMIPTQVFYGADGRELERHTGFIPEEAIVETFTRHAIDLGLPAAEEQ